MEIIPVQPPPKQFATGGMYRTIRHGPKGKDLSAKSITLPSEEPKICRPAKCLCKKGGSTTMKSQYLQPARPKNYAPIRVYKRPEHKIEDGTIYRKSYMPVDSDRPDLILPQNNIGLSRACFSKDTINKMSFPGWYGMEQRHLILPCNHDLMGKGPLADVTINRQDFVPKDVDRAEPILPRHNLGLTNSPLSNKTTNRLSYMLNDPTERRHLIIPPGVLEWPKGRMQGDTIQKMSFQPCKIPRKEFLPWAQKKKYETPTTKLSHETVYRKSYIPNSGQTRAGLIKPVENQNLLGDGKSFDSNTIHNMSYPGHEGFLRPDPVLPEHNIHLSGQRIDGRTIQKMSYQPNWMHLPPKPILPCNHDMSGKGPLSDLTTNRVDFQPVDSDRVEPIKPRPHLTLNNQPLSSRTINRLSYMDPGQHDATQKILPTNNLFVTTGAMETSTIQKMSYQPVIPQDKMAMPWAEKRKYCPPTQAFVDDTVYRMSFEAPGDWVGGGGGGGACECAVGCGCPCFESNQVEVPLIG